jgi:hypothetical protein
MRPLLLLLPLLSAWSGEFAHPLRTWQPLAAPDVEGVLVASSATAVTVRTVDGRSATLDPARLGIEDRRYLANLAERADPPRTWTFATPWHGMTAFTAAYVGRNGQQNERSKTYVTLILDDGRRRAFPLERFAPADREHALGRPEALGAPVADQEYALDPRDYDPRRDAVEVATTPHFAFWWGRDQQGFEPEAGKWKDPAFRAMNLRYFEEVWAFYRDRMRVPMPHAQDAQKTKINVYVTGTGLAKHKSGFAFGSQAIVIHPGAMLEGSSVVAHEFTHVLQFYLGGFRDNELVGFFWENHANWSAFQFIPDYPAALEVYADRAHYELNSSRHNYGSWPILQLLSERPGFSAAFPYAIWQRNRRSERGASLEDPFQVIMRCAVEDGQFHGDGVEDFGDVVGEVAAHDAAWDYVNQYRLEQVRGPDQRSSRNRTLLQPLDDRPGWYAPWHTHAPRQYGYDLVDLVPEAGATRLAVDLQGLAEEGQHSGWRATLVAIDDAGRCRYSRQWRSGSGSLAVHANDRQYVLAVAAAPTAYVPLGFRIGFNHKRRFLYEASFTGCTPAAAPPATLPPVDERAGARHALGGGWVAKGAKVDATAWVGPQAQVRDGAKVLGRARIEDHAVVMNGATVADEAVVGGWAVVRDGAKVAGQARVRDCAVVSGRAQVLGQAQVARYAHIEGQGSLVDQVLVRGFGEVHLPRPFDQVAGGTVMGEDLEAHIEGTLAGGMAYGFIANDQLKQMAKQDNRHLFANWVFRERQPLVLRDWNADCDGRLRGAPAYGERDGRLHLVLDGKTQYALVEGDAICSQELTIDAVLSWDGGAPDQRLLEFAGPGGALWLSPAGTAGGAELGIAVGERRQVLKADKPLPAKRWLRLTAMFAHDGARLFIDGQPAGQDPRLLLSPAEVPAVAGYLGRGWRAGKPFAGRLERLSLFRTAFARCEDVPPVP